MRIEEPVLVTGATGFIGGHLVDRLIRDGARPRLLVRGDPGRARARWDDRADVVSGDLADREAVARAAAGARTIFHLAALVGDAGTFAQHHAVTVEGTRNLMNAAAADRPRLVLTSSVAVYGRKIRTDVLDEDLPWGRPAGPYGTCKQEQERLAIELASRHHLPLVVVRPGNVYGPRSTLWVDAVIAELRRRTPVLIGGGEFDAGLCHVDNLVEILLLCAVTPEAAGRAYNASDGAGVTWKRYFGDLARIAGTPPPRQVPRALASGLAAVLEPAWRLLRLPGRPPLTGEALNLVGSAVRLPNARARRELGFEPVIRYEQALSGIEACLAGDRKRTGAPLSSPPA